MTLPHTATIQESIKTDGKYEYTDTDITKCFLQPLDEVTAQQYGITFTKAFECFLPVSVGVTESMRLKIKGVTYGVKGVKTHDYGSLQHTKAILAKV